MGQVARPVVHPGRLAVALLTLAVWTAITFLGAIMLAPEGPSLDQIVTGGIAWQIVGAAVLVLAVIRWQGWADIGLRAPLPGTLHLVWLPALIIAAMIGLTLILGPPRVAVLLMILANTCVVGLSEELMFRGVPFGALRGRLAIWPAILVTTALFGAVHVLNGFITGDFGSAAIQAMMAAGSGLMLMAIFLRTGALWTAIVIHALWDFAAFVMGIVGKTGADTGEAAAQGGTALYLAPLALILPNVLFALWLLRHVGRLPPPGGRQTG